MNSPTGRRAAADDSTLAEMRRQALILSGPTRMEYMGRLSLSERLLYAQLDGDNPADRDLRRLAAQAERLAGPRRTPQHPPTKPPLSLSA